MTIHTGRLKFRAATRMRPKVPLRDALVKAGERRGLGRVVLSFELLLVHQAMTSSRNLHQMPMLLFLQRTTWLCVKTKHPTSGPLCLFASQHRTQTMERPRVQPVPTPTHLKRLVSKPIRSGNGSNSTAKPGVQQPRTTAPFLGDHFSQRTHTTESQLPTENILYGT